MRLGCPLDGNEGKNDPQQSAMVVLPGPASMGLTWREEEEEARERNLHVTRHTDGLLLHCRPTSPSVQADAD